MWFHEGYLTLEGVNYSQEVEEKSPGTQCSSHMDCWMDGWMDGSGSFGFPSRRTCGMSRSHLTLHFQFLAQATHISTALQALQSNRPDPELMWVIWPSWNPKSTAKLEPSRGWLCSWTAARPRALHHYHTLRGSSAQWLLQSSSLVWVAQSINRIVPVHVSPHTFLLRQCCH